MIIYYNYICTVRMVYILLRICCEMCGLLQNVRFAADLLQGVRFAANLLRGVRFAANLLQSVRFAAIC
jgi:hypothetical protein